MIYGDNTDGIGLVRDVEPISVSTLGGSRILLMGAGGAAQGVLRPLLEDRPARVVIANRTVDKARVWSAIARHGESKHVEAHSRQLRAVARQDFDVVINATVGQLGR